MRRSTKPVISQTHSEWCNGHSVGFLIRNDGKHFEPIKIWWKGSNSCLNRTSDYMRGHPESHRTIRPVCGLFTRRGALTRRSDLEKEWCLADGFSRSLVPHSVGLVTHYVRNVTLLRGYCGPSFTAYCCREIPYRIVVGGMSIVGITVSSENFVPSEYLVLRESIRNHGIKLVLLDILHGCEMHFDDSEQAAYEACQDLGVVTTKGEARRRWERDE